MCSIVMIVSLQYLALEEKNLKAGVKKVSVYKTLGNNDVNSMN